jgi:lipopolysaccharide export system protein LptA
VLGVAAVLAAPVGAEPEAAGEAPAVPALAVVAFQVDSAPGTTVPDVATLLADRLGTRGAARVIGPAALGVEPVADADAASVQAWARDAGVEVVVLGRVTRIGNQLSVDLRLRDGESGGLMRTVVQEIARPEDLEQSVDTLAARVVEGVGTGQEPPEDAPDAPEGASTVARAPQAQAPAAGGAAPFGFRAWESNGPLSIESDELEASQQEGRRQLVFKKNVRVRQGDLRITCARLEAVYPEGGSQPDRLVATGSVTLAQGRQDARCDRATYDRVRERLTCQGHAEFRDGDNRLLGDVIEIDLRSEKVMVKGGASVLIQPEALKATGDEGHAS